MERDEDDITSPDNGGADNTAALAQPAIISRSTTIRIHSRQKRRNNYNKRGRATTTGSHQSHIVIIRIYIDIL